MARASDGGLRPRARAPPTPQRAARAPAARASAALIFVERALEHTRWPLRRSTWRRLLLCALLEAQKVLLEAATWNSDLSETFLPHLGISIGPADLAKLEAAFVHALGWRLHVCASEYADYFFCATALAHSARGRACAAELGVCARAAGAGGVRACAARGVVMARGSAHPCAPEPGLPCNPQTALLAALDLARGGPCVAAGARRRAPPSARDERLSPPQPEAVEPGAASGHFPLSPHRPHRPRAPPRPPPSASATTCAACAAAYAGGWRAQNAQGGGESPW